MAGVRTFNGRLRLVNGRLRLTKPGTEIPVDPNPGDGSVPGTSGTTSLALTEFYSTHQFARPVVQRSALSMSDSSGPWADVVFMFDYTGAAPGFPQVRVVNVAGGAAVKGWTTLTNVTASGGKGQGVARIPQGGYYLHELRDGQQIDNAATTSKATKSWGVGIVMLAIGQSNMLRTLNAGSSFDPVPGASEHEFDYWYAGKANATLFGTAGYFQPNSNGAPSGGSQSSSTGGGTLSIMRIVADRLSAKYGQLVPVGFIPWAWDGKDIGELVPDGVYSTPLFNGSGTAAGSIGMKSPPNFFGGDFEIVTWHQGESSNSRTRANYLQALKDLYTRLLAQVNPFGRTAQHLAFLPAVLGPYADVSGAEGKRGAVFDLDTYARANNWPKVRAGWNCLDLNPLDPSGDGLHFGDFGAGREYATWSARRMTQAILWALGCSTFTGLGPRIGSITRSGNVLTAMVAHDGGSALALRDSGSPITGWIVRNASGTAVTATVAVASASTITLTLPGGTTYPITVQHGGGMQPNVSNLIVDDIAYPQGCTGTDLIMNGRPLLPTPDPISVS